MSLFPETVKAYLAGSRVRIAWLVKLDFTSAPAYVWNGNGMLTAGGQEWAGLGALGLLSGIEQSINGEAPEATIGLSAVDEEIMTLALEEFETEALNRRIIAYIQFFNENDDIPLDNPYPVWSAKMILPTFSEDLQKWDINIAAESLFSYRSRPNYGMLTDRDQEKRFPGDRGFSFVNGLRRKVVKWPDF